VRGGGAGGFGAAAMAMAETPAAGTGDAAAVGGTAVAGEFRRGGMVYRPLGKTG